MILPFAFGCLCFAPAVTCPVSIFFSPAANLFRWRQGLVLQPFSPFSQARLSLTTGSAMAGVSFVDLYIRPAAGENARREEMIDVDSARIGLFKTATPDQAALWIFHKFKKQD